MKRIVILIIGCIGAVALGAVTFWLCAPRLSMDATEAFRAAVDVFSAVVALCGLVYAGLSFADVAAAQRAENAYKLRMNSFEFIEKWRLDNRARHMALVFEMAKDGELRTLDDLTKILSKSEKKQEAITDLLNFFESVGMAIHAKVVDGPILQDYLSEPFRTLILPLRDLIRLQQDKRSDPTVLANVIALGRRWGMPFDAELSAGATEVPPLLSRNVRG
jgi:hypothetical protein